MPHKGFTLIEVLIVVVIIAVLASLILPRFMGQSERAVIGEAQQMLGAIRRGQLRYQEMGGGGGGTHMPLQQCGFQVDCADSADEWARIGVTPPAKGTGSFDYGCDLADACWAERGARPPGNPYIGSEIMLTTSTAAFTCVDKYVNIDVDGKRGCAV